MRTILRTAITALLLICPNLVFGQSRGSVQYNASTMQFSPTNLLWSNIYAGTNIVLERSGQFLKISSAGGAGEVSTVQLNAASNAILAILYGVGENDTNYAQSTTNGLLISAATLGTNHANQLSVALSNLSYSIGLNGTNYANGLVSSATNGFAELTGDTFIGAVLSTAASASNAPAANEFPTAQWVRGLLTSGTILYGTTVAEPNATNTSSTNVIRRLSTVAPAQSVFEVQTPTNGQYVVEMVTTNTFSAVDGIIGFNIYMSSTTGGGDAIGVHTEVYYSYDRTNWYGDWECQNQTIGTGTNLYTFSVPITSVLETNASGFYLKGALKVGSVASTPLLSVWLGTNTASYMSFSHASSTASGNAYLANDQTFTGTNNFSTGKLQIGGTNATTLMSNYMAEAKAYADTNTIYGNINSGTISASNLVASRLLATDAENIITNLPAGTAGQIVTSTGSGYAWSNSPTSAALYKAGDLHVGTNAYITNGLVLGTGAQFIPTATGFNFSTYEGEDTNWIVQAENAWDFKVIPSYLGEPMPIASEVSSTLLRTVLVATNDAAVSNFVLNVSPTNAHIELILTNNIAFTNFGGLARNQACEGTIWINPTGVNRTATWATAMPGVPVVILTNANNTLWTTLTNDKTYKLDWQSRVTTTRTNIHFALSLWE